MIRDIQKGFVNSDGPKFLSSQESVPTLHLEPTINLYYVNRLAAGDFVPLAGSSSVFPCIFAATLAMTAMVRQPVVESPVLPRVDFEYPTKLSL